MKNTILFLLLLVNISSHAVVTQDQESVCKETMAMAEAAITARYQGVALSAALDNTAKMVEQGKASIGQSSIMKSILRDAYDEPRYTTIKYKQNHVKDFSAKYYLACMEAIETNQIK